MIGAVDASEPTASHPGGRRAGNVWQSPSYGSNRGEMGNTGIVPALGAPLRATASGQRQRQRLPVQR